LPVTETKNENYFKTEPVTETEIILKT